MSGNSFEKGPLRWLLGLTPGQRKRPGEITLLIAHGLRDGRSLERLGLALSAALGETIDPPESIDSQVVVLAHLMASANAGRLLVRHGYLRAAESQLRAMVEAFALLQCLHGDEARSRLWRNARTTRERRKFEFAELKRCSRAARDLEPLWNDMNEHVHANSTATPAHSLRRSVFGYDVSVGPLYEPIPLAAMLGVINGVEYLVLEWCIQNLVPKPNLRLVRYLQGVGARVKTTTDSMNAHARSLKVPTSDGIPIADQRRAVAHMTRRARRAGRRDVARWLVARAKSPK